MQNFVFVWFLGCLSGQVICEHGFESRFLLKKLKMYVLQILFQINLRILNLQLQHNGRAHASLSRDLGFKSHLVLGFFLLLCFPTFLHLWSVLNQVPQGRRSLTGCCERKKWMPGCAARGEAGSKGSNWVLKI